MGTNLEHLYRAAAMLPIAPWVMSSVYENTRTGIIVRRVMQCADEPLCVGVSMRKGSRIDPIIRDSHVFAISLMDTTGNDKLLLKKFDTPEATDEDPFDAYRVMRLKTGCPVMAGARLAFDCEVLSHVDLEADCELFVGRVLDVFIAPMHAEATTPTLAPGVPTVVITPPLTSSMVEPSVGKTGDKRRRRSSPDGADPGRSSTRRGS